MTALAEACEGLVSLHGSRRVPLNSTALKYKYLDLSCWGPIAHVGLATLVLHSPSGLDNFLRWCMPWLALEMARVAT
eukprot:183213-Amphidinium_carterae.3